MSGEDPTGGAPIVRVRGPMRAIKHHGDVEIPTTHATTLDLARLREIDLLEVFFQSQAMPGRATPAASPAE